MLYLRNFQLWLEFQGIQNQSFKVARGATGEFSSGNLFTPKNDNGKIVIALHSTGCDRFMPLVKLYEAILARGYRVVCIDLDGHGKDSSTVFDADASLDRAYVHILDDLLKSEISERVSGDLHLIGQSLGGCSIVDFMAKSVNASKISSVTFVGMPLFLSFKKISVLKEAYSFVSPTLWGSVRSYGFPGVMPAPGKIRRRQFPIRVQAQKSPINEIVRYINGLNVGEKISRIEVPILNIVGSLDSIAQGQTGNIQARDLKNFEIAAETHYSLLYSEKYFQEFISFLNCH